MPQRQETLWTKAFLLITAVNALAFFGFNMSTTGFPAYLALLNADEVMIGISTSFAATASLTTRPIAGHLIYKYSHKRICFLGFALMAVPCVVTPVLSDNKLVLMMRFLQGVGWGLSSTCCSSMIAHVSPHSRLSEGIGYTGAVSSIATAFASASAISLLMDFGAVAMVLSIGTAIVIAAFLLSVLPFAEMCLNKSHNVKLYKSLVDKNALFPAILIFFITFSYSPIVTFVVRYAELNGFVNVGLFFLCYAIATVISRPITGVLVDKYGCNIPAGISILFAFLSLILLFVACSSITFYLAAVLSGISTGVGMNALQTMALRQSPPKIRTVTMSTFLFGFDMGMAFGSAVAGVLIKSCEHRTMYGIVSLVPLVGLLFFVVAKLLKRKRM